MSWADVWKYFHETGDVSKIAEYCEKDVKATIEVYKKILECVNI
jgi:predicted PolB exonuclease-like 3'-5' exonuclease